MEKKREEGLQEKKGKEVRRMEENEVILQVDVVTVVYRRL